MATACNDALDLIPAQIETLGLSPIRVGAQTYVCALSPEWQITACDRAAAH